MAEFQSVLYLDDLRVPVGDGVALVRNYREFVEYLETKGMPDLISFDHDLAPEHYPLGLNRAGEKVPYSTYREETGMDCARFVIENRLPLRHWAVHSSNVQGKLNLERMLRRYHRRGEVRGLLIPFAMRPSSTEAWEVEEVSVSPPPKRFSSTSLFQFEEEIPLESWERGLPRGFVRG